MNRIKDLREDSDLSQAQLAELLGYHTTTYARWEREDHKIRLCDAVVIAKHYNVSLDYIAGLIDQPRALYEKKIKAKKEEKAL